MAVPDDLADWAKESLVELFGLEPGQLIEFSPRGDEFLSAPTIVIPTMIHWDHHFHPVAAEFYANFLRAAIGNPLAQTAVPSLMFLTRGKLSSARALENNDAVEQLFQEEGFTLVSPESLGWRDQIALFQNAKIVAGEHGSAMKNMLFAPGGAVQLVINRLNPNQVTIAAMKQQFCLILKADGFRPKNYQVPYRVDLVRLRQAIRQVKSAATRFQSERQI